MNQLVQLFSSFLKAQKIRLRPDVQDIVMNSNCMILVGDDDYIDDDDDLFGDDEDDGFG